MKSHALRLHTRRFHSGRCQVTKGLTDCQNGHNATPHGIQCRRNRIVSLIEMTKTPAVAEVLCPAASNSVACRVRPASILHGGTAHHYGTLHATVASILVCQYTRKLVADLSGFSKSHSARMPPAHISTVTSANQFKLQPNSRDRVRLAWICAFP